MRRHLSLLPVLLAALGAAASDHPIASRPPDASAVREVASGKRRVARAAWWGFNPTNTTAALQAAINSGARKVLVENLGAPWIVDKIRLASDQEVIFERGVEVQALRGAFHDKGGSLFTATLNTNVTLTGYGATLRMWKQDYDSRDYTKSEWRHVLSLRSCSRVRVTGLTLADSGGDGIYLGVARQGVPNSDVVIKDVCCVNNYRQGISVISARNLLIEDCLLRDTGGTAPQAGIDFEPNLPSEQLVNCIMRNCVSENNRGDAYTFYLKPLRAASEPISIRLENCRARGCRRSLCFVTGNDEDGAAVTGSAEFINCKLENSQAAGIEVGSKPPAGCRVSFLNCAVLNAATNQPAMTPIHFSTRAGDVAGVGGVRFVNCTVQDTLQRLPMSFQDTVGGLDLSEVTGTLTVRQGGKRALYRLDPALVAAWMPHRVFKQFPRVETKGLRYEPVFPSTAPDPHRKSPARQRGRAAYLLWAEAGQPVSFTVRLQAVGRGKAVPVPVVVIAPSGRQTTSLRALDGEDTAGNFTAGETGAYKIVCEAGSATLQVNSSHRVCLFSETGSIHFLGTTGEFFFWVPAGVGECAVKVSGDNAAERVKAAVYDPSGAKIEEKDNIAEAHQFLIRRADATAGAVCSLRLDRPGQGILEDFRVELQGIPPVLATTREALLRPAK